MSNSIEQPGPTPDEIDAALESFWQGSSREFDQLIDGADGQGPAIGLALSCVIESQWSSLVESYSIPGYSLIREIGRGGMAIVFEAIQQSTGRHVALKLVPASGISRERQARFLRREAQTLSLLRHDGIATLFDAGQTNDNCQYFAMELVDGKPLSQHFATPAVSDHADLRRRLELVLDVCNAVAYAHGRGVIHCDLKPSNVLVDERGRAKVLDFGLARLLEIDPTVSLSLGGSGLMGTLAYMSPEQASGRATDIDIRSDVYAIGIMLYELTVGRRPHDLMNTQFPQAIQRICHVEPRSPREENPLLRGDIDTIITTALAKEPSRRYQTVAALAADLQRYLDCRPIEARPASTAYVLAKWCSRHRLSAGLIAVIVLLIGAFAVIEIRHAFQIAAQRDEARQHAKRANQANAFLRSIFGTLDPKLTGADVSVITVLDDAASRVDKELSDNQKARAELHSTFGNSYYALARFQSAEIEFEKAAALWKSLAGEIDASYASSLHMSGMASLRSLDPKAGASRIRRAYEIRQNLFQGDNVDLAESLHGLGVIHLYVDFPAAEAYLRRSLEMRQRLLGDHPLVAQSLDSLGRMMLDSGRFSDAEPLLVQALEMRKRLLGADATDVAVTLGLLAGMHDQCGFAAKAADEYGEQIRIFTKAFGAKGSEFLAHAMSDMAGALAELGRFAEAEGYHKKAVAMEERCGANGAAELTQHNYAWFLRSLGRYDEAELLARKVSDSWGKTPDGEVHTGIAYAAQNLGSILLETGRIDEAVDFLEQADQVWCKLLGTESPKRLNTLVALAQVDEERGDLRAAESKLLTAIQMMTQSVGGVHPETAMALMKLGRIEFELGMTGEGERLIQEAYDKIQNGNQAGRLLKLRAVVCFADALNRWGEIDAAAALFDEALAADNSLKLDRHPLRADALLGLAEILDARGNKSEAKKKLADALEIYTDRNCLDRRRTQLTSALKARLQSATPQGSGE